MKMSDILEQLQSPEMQKKMGEYINKCEKNDEILNIHIDIFHTITNKKDIIEKIINKYNSYKYIIRYQSRGREPKKSLFWFLLYYARMYGTECTDNAYNGMFITESYYVCDYVVRLMEGQGSYVLVDKIK